MNEPVLVGRSSSHFTRLARVFAVELDVPHVFRPVLDLTTLDPSAYGDNPALKIPVLIDDEGPLYGAENVCGQLTRLAKARQRVVLRGDVSDRLVVNAEELTMHAMSSEVSLIMARGPNGEKTEPPKVRQSLQNCLEWLDQRWDQVLGRLPDDRTISIVEAALFCLVTHLPFRQIADVSGYARLGAFCNGFGERPGAVQTQYRFDAGAVGAPPPAPSA